MNLNTTAICKSQPTYYTYPWLQHKDNMDEWARLRELYSNCCSKAKSWGLQFSGKGKNDKFQNDI